MLLPGLSIVKQRSGLSLDVNLSNSFMQYGHDLVTLEMFQGGKTKTDA